ncbi:MAG: efflux RND transporter periplasmic adaptor subunit [Chitinivibrionales bacterium]|nr:efflux RND transporter periplasmic adaptor subunit [Chitinivibrionales bacterium]
MSSVRLLVTAGCILLSACQFSAREEARPSRLHMQVTAARAQKRTLRKVKRFSGVLAAQTKTDLAPATAGRVRKFTCEIGQHVRNGQVLAVMDDAQLVGAIARFQPLKAQYSRVRSLLDKNSITRTEFERVEAEYIAAKRMVEQLQENTAIKAPFDGVVTHRAVEEGELYSPQMIVSAGRSFGLLQVAQLERLILDIDVDDKSVVHVKKGQAVDLYVDVVADTVFAGKILRVNPLGNELSHTFGVRIIIDNPGLRLKAGYFAEAHIITGEKDEVIAVPEQAVLENKLFVIRGGKALRRNVAVGWATQGWAEIIDGLCAGDTVVVSGNKALPDSSEVTVVSTLP